MNYSAILLLAVSTFPASHGVLASSDRAAPESNTITTTGTTTTLMATTAKEPSSHDAAMQTHTQSGDILDADVPKMNPPTAAAADADADAVTTITNTETCKK